MPPTNNEQLQEIHKLVRDNNRMLRSMRRNAFLGSILKLLVYVGVALAGLWMYLTFVAPIMEQMLKTIEQVQGTGTQAQVQLQGLQDSLKKLQSLVPGYSSAAESQQ